MKQHIVLTTLLLLLLNFSEAQPKDYKVVFDLTSNDTTDHKTVIRWLNGITQSNADARLEVVFYGQSLGMVAKDKSTVAEDIKKLTANKKIGRASCRERVQV